MTEDASPRGGVTFALWEPPLLRRPEAARAGPRRVRSAPPRTPSVAAGAATGATVPAAAVALARSAGRRRRRPCGARPRETADLLTDPWWPACARSRSSGPAAAPRSVATVARRALDEVVPGLGDRVAAYRAGYLREERRALEHGLLVGALLGLASTNALELGVDLVGLDAVLICGYPGTRASLWQQAGRAGRAGGDALAVWWPATTRSTPIWCTTPRRCSAGRSRRPCSTRPTRTSSARSCAARRPKRRSPRPTSTSSAPAAGAGARRAGRGRTAAPPPDRLVLDRTSTAPTSTCAAPAAGRSASSSRATGRLLGTVDRGSVALTRPRGRGLPAPGRRPTWSTPRPGRRRAPWSHADDPTGPPTPATSPPCPSSRSRIRSTPARFGCFLGEVDVTSQVVVYQRRRLATGEVIDTRPLDLPPRELRTVAVWCTVSPDALAAAGVRPADVPGALHAAEHAAIGLLPLVATCDRWDIGGLSTATAPGHRSADGLRLRRPPRRRRLRRAGVRRGRATGCGATRDGDRRVRVRGRLPVLRAVAQVRQRQRAARQGPGRRGTGHSLAPPSAL